MSVACVPEKKEDTERETERVCVRVGMHMGECGERERVRASVCVHAGREPG